jgi:Glycosyltransferase family 87
MGMATVAATATATAVAAAGTDAVGGEDAPVAAHERGGSRLTLPLPFPAGGAFQVVRSRTAIVVALGVSTFLVAWGTLHYGFYTHELLVDTPIYQSYGDATLRGEIPYRNFAVEYPPGALPVFVLPSVVSGQGHFGTYNRVFEALMGLCGMVAVAAVTLIVVRLERRRIPLAAAVGIAGLGALALGPVVLSRFDLWPAMLTVGALALLVYERRRLAFAALGLGFAAKLFPALLLPPMLVYVWRRTGRRQAALCGLCFAAVAFACYAPFLVLSPHGVWASIGGQASRPLQIESLGASLLLAAHQLAGTTMTMDVSHGSNNLVGSVPDRLALGQAILQILVIVAIWISFLRGPADRERLLRTCAACVCAFIAFGKVLSPQYLVWLLPLIPLIRGRRGVIAGALLVAAMLLTQLWFPYRYLELVYEFDARASWFVFSRDLALVALLAALVWPRRRARTGEDNIPRSAHPVAG